MSQQDPSTLFIHLRVFISSLKRSDKLQFRMWPHHQNAKSEQTLGASGPGNSWEFHWIPPCTKIWCFLRRRRKQPWLVHPEMEAGKLMERHSHTSETSRNLQGSPWILTPKFTPKMWCNGKWDFYGFLFLVRGQWTWRSNDDKHGGHVQQL